MALAAARLGVLLEKEACAHNAAVPVVAFPGISKVNMLPPRGPAAKDLVRLKVNIAIGVEPPVELSIIGTSKVAYVGVGLLTKGSVRLLSIFIIPAVLLDTVLLLVDTSTGVTDPLGRILVEVPYLNVLAG